MTRTRMLALGSIGSMLVLAGCPSTAVFQSSFNSNTVGSPPTPTQSTGTISVAGVPGSVVIVAPFANATGNWAQLSRTAGDSIPITTMLCTLSRTPGVGTYGLLAVLFIPKGSGLATVSFMTSAQSGPPSAEFLHLDFLQNNTVRINDNGAQTFGTFPRDQFFTLSVTLVVTASSATAHMQLFGAGASGTTDFNVTPVGLATQFGAVQFWMGFNWAGSFDAQNILVSYKP
jgi:hypothetical protein